MALILVICSLALLFKPGVDACKEGENVDLTNTNISIKYDFTNPSPPIIAFKSYNSQLTLELFIGLTWTIEENSPGINGNIIYGPEEYSKADLLTDPTSPIVHIYIHYESDSHVLQIFSATKNEAFATTSNLSTFGINPPVDLVEVFVDKGDAQCLIVTTTDAEPCTNIPISWKNVIAPKTSLEDGDNMTVSCSAGYYLLSGSGVVFCNEGVLSPAPSCIVHCPPGTYKTGFGMKECRLCPAGTFRSEGMDMTNCKPCKGRITISEPGSECCRSCPPGTVASKSKTECLPCYPGTYRISHMKVCNRCEGNLIQPDIGASSCIACPAGMVSNNNKTECVNCPAGRFRSEEMSLCLRCPGFRSISSTEGATKCEECPNGLIANWEKTECLHRSKTAFSKYNFSDKCKRNTINLASGGFAPCKECPPGTVANDDKTECVDCPSGFYRTKHMLLCGRCVGHLTYTTGGAAECSSCPDGQVANWDKSGCVNCPTGNYRSGTLRSCHICQTNTEYSPTEGAAHCLKCPPGTKANALRTECVQCPAGSFRMDHMIVCQPCRGSQFIASQPGAVECVKCPSRFKSNLGKTECIESSSPRHIY